MTDGADVRIRLLGGFEATVAGEPVPTDAWRLRKAKTLVKLLVLADGHRTHRESLVAVLWPDRDRASGMNNLHQALYVARRALAGSGTLFVLRDDVVLLSDGSPPWLDVVAFEAACRSAHLTRAPEDFAVARELYRGELLPEDRFEPWAQAPREALAERRLGLLLENAELLSQRREFDDVIEVVGAIIAADPFQEGAYRLLMTALAARGRRYEALAAFDRLRESLTQELAADPEPATCRLYRDLLAGTNTSSPPALEAFGAHPRPAAEGGLDSDGPGLAKLSKAIGSEPGSAAGPGGTPLGGMTLERTSFIGRRRELTEVAQALGRTSLLTLTGPGGAGKTRLALEVANGLVSSYPDGVHLVELASLTRPELVPHAVAFALDVVIAGSEPAEVALARLVVDRRLLLVLDNCEHLLEACARLVSALLRICPGIVVLATSREPLRIGGEVTWRTPSLALPDVRALPSLDRLAEFESVRLFIERARDVAADFVFDEATAPAVVEICVRLDGMPLAIELAAARTSALAPSQLAARLGDALRVLDRGSRSALTRQQTLHATLSWSHDLLDTPERTLFRRLAVFHGNMTLEAIENICGGAELDVVDLLSRLVDKSLVQAEHAAGTARYRLLETIRQFADQCLSAAGEKTERVRDHREFFVALAVANDPERASGVVNESPEALDAEHDNLRAALSTGLIDDPEAALRLALSLWRFWLARGEFSEASRWLAAALAAAPERTTSRARALLAASAIEVRRGDPSSRQVTLSTEAVAIMREVGEAPALAQTLQSAGLLAWVFDHRRGRAVELVEESRALAAAVGDTGAVASATHTLGVIAVARGAGAQAVAHFDTTLDVLEKFDAGRSPFFSALTPGHFWEIGPGGAPRLPFTETVLLFRRVGVEQARAYALSNLSYALSLVSDEARATQLMAECLHIFDRIGDLHGSALALCHQANRYRVAGDIEAAAELLQRSMAIRRRLGDRRGVAMTILNQGLVAAGGGDLARADGLLRDALIRFDDMGDGPGRSGTLLDLGLILFDAGDDERARRVLGRWHDLPLIAWTFRARAWATLTLAAVEMRCGDPQAAARRVDEARRGFTALADEPGLAYLDAHAEQLLSEC